MTEMFQSPTFLYLIVLCQVLVLSYVLPRVVLRRAEHILATYPPTDYPRLYPVDRLAVSKALERYRTANRVALVVGFALVAHALITGSAELLGWDSGSVIALYGLLQLATLGLVAMSGFAYFNGRRRPDRRAKRTAQLRPRRLFDYVSPALLAVAVVVYLGFVAFIAYVDRFGFSWFGGYWNIVGITAMNVMFGAIIFRKLRSGARSDPYQSADQTDRQLVCTFRVLLVMSVISTCFVVLAIGIRALDQPALIPVCQSLFLQFSGLLALREFRIDSVDFEVYRDGAVAV